MTRLASVLAIAFASALIGCAGSHATGPAPATPATKGDTAMNAPASGGGGGGSAGVMAQIAAGKKVYSDNCAMCHGDDGKGKGKTPAIVGAKALDDYKTGADLLAFVSKKMPKDDPGSLSAKDDAAVVAFTLKQNGVALTAPVTAQSAAGISIH